MVEQASMMAQSNGQGRVKESGGLIRVRVHCTHVTPILMNAMTAEKLLQIRDKTKASKNAAKPTPKEEAKEKLHLLHNGRPHLPVNAFMKTLMNAGQHVRLDGKRQISTANKTVLTSMLSLEEVELPLFKPGTNNAATWETDIQRGKNPNGGEAVCIVRPRFDEWEIRLTVEIDQREMPLSMARELFDKAGSRIGFLEFTPLHKGTYGRWVVSKWKILKE